MWSISRNITFRAKGTYPGLHFHRLVQEDSGEGDGVDGCPEGEDVDIRVLVGLQGKNKQASSDVPVDSRPQLGRGDYKASLKASVKGSEWAGRNGEKLSCCHLCGNDAQNRWDEELTGLDNLETHFTGSHDGYTRTFEMNEGMNKFTEHPPGTMPIAKDTFVSACKEFTVYLAGQM